MHHAFVLSEAEHGVELSRSATSYRLYYEDRTIEIELHPGLDGHARLSIDGEVHHVVMSTRGDEVFIHLDGEAYALRYRHPLDRLAAQAHETCGAPLGQAGAFGARERGCRLFHLQSILSFIERHERKEVA